MAPELPASYADSLRRLTSLAAVVLVVALDRQLTRHYWHNLPKDEGFPFLALCEHTNFVSPEHFGGDHIVYCGDYLPPEPRAHAHGQGGGRAPLPAGARPIQPRLRAELGAADLVVPRPYAQPVPPVDHGRDIPALRTPLPGLYLASMSQVYPWDRGTNFAVEIGRRVARLMLDDLR